jgi:erythromycin esterase
MKNITLLVLAILFLNGCAKKIDENPTPISGETLLTQNAAELNKLIVPMQHEPLNLSDAELAYFDDLKSAQIIGLGEATHGSKEFFQMKHRLFKYFVEHFNHKVFAFEMDFSESLIFDEYLQTGNGDIEKLMKEKMYFWTWNTSEVKDLLVWMKDYNIGKSSKERLHIYGVDCQTFRYNVPELIKRVSVIDAKMGQEISNLLTDLNVDKFEGKKANILLVNELIKNNKASLTLKSSSTEYDFIEHIADIIVQTETDLTSNNQENRDLFMAENTIWLKKHTAYPMSVWAHNAHIKNTESSNASDRMMGYHINNKLQGGYSTIGFSFAEGSVTAVDSESNKLGYYNFGINSFTGYSNELLSKAKTPNFFYKTAIVYRNAGLRSYFDNTPFYQIGAVFYAKPMTPDVKVYVPLLEVNYNYVIHINKTTNSDNYWLRK